MLEDGSAADPGRMWDHRMEGHKANSAAATTSERKARQDVSINDIEQVLTRVAAERNMKGLGEPALS